MARTLAASTLKRFRKLLDAERERLLEVIRDIEAEQEELRLSETSSERSPDPNTAEGGSLAFEVEKELSLYENAKDLLSQAEHGADSQVILVLVPGGGPDQHGKRCLDNIKFAQCLAKKPSTTNLVTAGVPFECLPAG